MARPTKCRRICELPGCRSFIPETGGQAESVTLALDEYEALRLIDLLGYNQAECAAQMNVARTTVQLIYDAARKKVADALVGGKGIRIEGGRYELCGSATGCCAKRCRRNGNTCARSGAAPTCGCRRGCPSATKKQ